MTLPVAPSIQCRTLGSFVDNECECKRPIFVITLLSSGKG
jgi:hypothetical protein